MKRPPVKILDSKVEDKWENHKQQILTYSWLRSKQEDAKPIVAGIIFYLNELVPSKEDLVLIKDEINNDLTDVGQEYERDVDLINKINVDESEQDEALLKFDSVVANIENSLIKEMKGCKIQEAWKADSDERTCSACDFKTFCKNNSVKTEEFKIP